MTTELLTLIVLALLCLALPLIYAPLYSRQVGMSGVLSNRDAVPEPQGAAGRGLRAHRNLLENLLPFAVLVLVAHVMGISNSMTVLMAQIFLGARLVHTISYLAGITKLRTVAYNIGTAAQAVFAVQLFL